MIVYLFAFLAVLCALFLLYRSRADDPEVDPFRACADECTRDGDECAGFTILDGGECAKLSSRDVCPGGVVYWKD